MNVAFLFRQRLAVHSNAFTHLYNYHLVFYRGRSSKLEAIKFVAKYYAKRVMLVPSLTRSNDRVSLDPFFSQIYGTKKDAE